MNAPGERDGGTSPVPVIETRRLRMRAHTTGDFEPFAAMWGDPGVVRYITGVPSSRSESWSRLLRHAGHWALLGFGYWALEDRETGRFCGEVGFAEFRRDIVPSLEGLPEIGWVLPPEAHGRGLATEAVEAAITWGSGRFGAVRTACILSPDNRPSIRVAEKCGYRPWARTRFGSAPAHLYARTLTG